MEKESIIGNMCMFMRGNDMLKCVNDMDIQIAVGVHQPPQKKSEIREYVRKKIWLKRR